MYEMSQRHPVWVAENHVSPCNSVTMNYLYAEFIGKINILLFTVFTLLYNDKNSFLRNKLLSHLTGVNQKYGEGKKNENG